MNARPLAAALLALSLVPLSGSAAMRNVLSLGVKNDGSADVSALVNAATARDSLFFPAGRYRVEHPIVLKNPIRGEGYSRCTEVNDRRTWFVSALTNALPNTGVLNFSDGAHVNVEEINVSCCSEESAIRIEPCSQGTMTFIDRVGIFNLGGTGIHVKGRGSRPVFIQNVTVFGRAFRNRSLGVDIDGPADCRVMNVEAMGVRIGLRVFNGHTYGSNLHLWTGSMAGTDNGSWWHGTRALVLGPGAHFSGSQIYPDTSFYAIEQIGDGGLCEIANVMYWEDNSIKVAANHDGEFYHRAPGSTSRLVINGGLVGVGGSDAKPGWMAKMYTSEPAVRDVAIKSAYALKGANLDRLCFGGALPDYEVRYDDAGWCKFADVFTVAPTGCCEGELTLGDGAAWKVSLCKGTDGQVTFAATPLNPLCAGRTLRKVDGDGLAKLYYPCAQKAPSVARFRTSCMQARFRPVDHASLRGRDGKSRYREVLPLTSEN